MLATGVFAGPAPSGKKTTTSSASSVKELVEPKQPNKNGRERLPTRFSIRPCPRVCLVMRHAFCFAEEEAKTSKDQGGKCGLKKPWKQQVRNEIDWKVFFVHNPKLCNRKCRWSGRISDLNQIYSRALTKSDGLGGLPIFFTQKSQEAFRRAQFQCQDIGRNPTRQPWGCHPEIAASC